MSPSTALLLYNAPLLATDASTEALAERGVLETVDAVAKVLESRGWAVKRWALSPSGVSRLARDLQKSPPTVVVNLFEGFPGADHQEALVVELLEKLGVPYTGSGPQAIELCRRKEVCGLRLRSAGIPTPEEWVALGGLGGIPEEPLPWPLLIKPAWEDGSVGITRNAVVHSLAELERYVAEARSRFNGAPLLIQEYVEGREFAVSLIGPPPMSVLGVSEMDFSKLPGGHPLIVTDEAKWCVESDAYKGVVSRCPAEVAPGVERSLQSVAQAAARQLGLRDYARVDMRLRGGRPFVIDANPNPDLAPSAGFARCAEAAGMTFDDLVERLVEYAITRK